MSTSTEKLPEGFLKMLVCPVTRSPLRQEGEELVGAVGGLRYPIRNGIPILLPDEAKLPEGYASLDAFMAKHKGSTSE